MPDLNAMIKAIQLAKSYSAGPEILKKMTFKIWPVIPESFQDHVRNAVVKDAVDKTIAAERAKAAALSIRFTTILLFTNLAHLILLKTADHHEMALLVIGMFILAVGMVAYKGEDTLMDSVVDKSKLSFLAVGVITFLCAFCLIYSSVQVEAMRIEIKSLQSTQEALVTAHNQTMRRLDGVALRLAREVKKNGK